MEWNMTVESEVTKDLVVRAMYVGTRGVHLFARGNLNQPVPGPASGFAEAVSRFTEL